MSRLVVLSAVVILTVQCLVLAAPAAGDKPAPPATQPTTQPVADGKPINKFCAVNKGEEIDPTVTTIYQGKVIGFCCEDCIPKFKKDPEKYMKDLK